MMSGSVLRFTVAAGLLALVLGLLAKGVSAENEAVPSDLSLLEVHESAGVACNACHSDTPFDPRPGFAVCVACHGTMTGTDNTLMIEGPDPHRSPHLAPDETADCTSCHRIHQPTEVTCTMCHRAFHFNIR